MTHTYIETRNRIAEAREKQLASYVALVKGILEVVSPEMISNIEKPYDSGRFDERIRIRNGIVDLAAECGIRV